MPKQKTQKNEGMRILKLEAENIKRIKAVEITPKDDVVIISGANAQGKTSVLDSIWFTLGGKKGIPQKPIRKGKKSARVRIELGSKTHKNIKYIVERVWTDDEHSYLSVTTGKGDKFATPQKLLDGFIGELAFDPLEFSRADKKEQRGILLEALKIRADWNKLEQMTGADWSHYGDYLTAIDAAHQNHFTARTDVNRDIKEIKIKIDSIEIPEEYENAEPITMSELYEKQRQINKAIEYKEEVERKVYEISQLQGRIKELQGMVNNLKKAGFKVEDTEEIENQIKNAQEFNKYAQLKKTRENMEDELGGIEKQAKIKTTILENLKQLKTDLVSKSKLPIDGLGFTDEGVSFKGIPFGQASDSEKLKISMAIAMAFNPELRTIRITDGSLLDSKSKEYIRKVAKEKDYQIWIEVVDETGDVGVYIEDGSVKKGG